MKPVLVVAKRDFSSFFYAPLGWVVITSVLFLSGYFFFSFVAQFNQAVVQTAKIPGIAPQTQIWIVYPFYKTLSVILLFMLPLLSMRSFAEEAQRGTLKLLFTSAISNQELVWGKFLGTVFITLVILSTAFIFPLLQVFLSATEVAPLFTSSLGIVLYALALSALGLFVSAITKSPLLAALLSFILFFMLFLIEGAVGKLPPLWAPIISYISPTAQLDSFLKGVLDSKNIIYFFSVIACGVFLAERVVEVKRPS
ncbi:ABC transporter permease subunit [bacterium]|nr:ABC transporter permease subunit [bacterium]